MPGRCPSCNQTYTDETLSFCPNDGTPLVKDAAAQPYDPQATMIAQPPPNYPPQQPSSPQDYYAPPGGQTPPPQGGQQASPPPSWQQPPAYGQQPPPYGQQQQHQYAPQYGAVGSGAKSKMPLILAIAGIIVIGGAIGLFFLLRGNSSSSSSSSTPSTRSTSTTSTTSTVPTPSTTSSFPTPSTSTTTTTTSTYTEDEKYRIFFAAAKTGDAALQTEIAKKIGIIDSSGMPTDYYEPFIKGAGSWGIRDAAWVRDHNSPAAAREYVDAHR